MQNTVGFWNRFFASLLDSLLLGLPVTIIAVQIWDVDQYATDIFNILYPIILPILWTGYTVGKRIIGIRIVKVNGDDVTILTMLLRVILGNLIYTLTFGVGVIVSAFMIGLRHDNRSIHDFIAGTYVTSDRP